MSICLSGLKAKAKPIAITVKPSANHPLLKLAQVMPWALLAEMVMPDLMATTAKGFFNLGRKLKLRVHLGVYLLQQMQNMTDRQTEWQLKDNAAFQIFCGFGVVDGWRAPDHTKIEEFRSRLSPETQVGIANAMASLGVKMGFGDPSKMDQDSTVQEAGITYPSDARLLVKMAGNCRKVYDFFVKMIPDGLMEKFNFKRVKASAREYFFLKTKDIEVRRAKFQELFYATFLECSKATELSLAKRHIEAMPWNIRRAWDQIKAHAKKYFQDVEQFAHTGTKAVGKALSFHLSEVSCFDKNKEGKDYQFGRQFQIGRIGGNFMIVGNAKSVREEDKKSVKPMLSLHQKLFGEETLESYGTDKGYYSNANRRVLERTKGLAKFHLQKPGMALDGLPEEEQKALIELTNRRAGIEPLIGHIKRGGQLGRSRMRTNKSTLASGYAAVGGFNLRQIIRHQLGKKIKAM